MKKVGWGGFDFSHGVSGFIRSLVSGPAPSTLLDDLVSYWPLDEISGTRYDAVGSNDLTDNNTVGAVLRGPEGTVAKLLQANTEYLSNASWKPDTAGGWTYSFWLDVTTTPAGGYQSFYHGYPSYAGNGSTAGQYGVGPLSLLFNFNTTGVDSYAIGALQVGWNHCLMWLDPADRKTRIRINGASVVVSGTALPSMPNFTDSGFVINGIWTGTSGMDSLQSCFAAWNRVLTEAEQDALFASGNGIRYVDLSDGIKADLVSWFELDEVSGVRYDSHGSNHLTDNNTVGSVNSGPKGVVSNFVAANSEYLRSDSNPFSTKSATSVAVWIRLTGTGGTYPCIIGSGINARVFELYFGSSSQLGLYLGFTNGSGLLTAGPYSFPLDQWHLVYADYDSGAWSVYVDNVLQGSNTHGSGALIAGSELEISGPFYYGSYINGNVSTPAVWSRPLTAGERTSLFNSGRGKRYADLTTAEKVGLVSYWNLDEQSGIRYDSHGTNHLTDNNTVGSVINAGAAMDGAAASFVSANAETLTSATPVIDTSTDWTLAVWFRPTATGYHGLFASLSYPQQNHAGFLMEVQYAGSYNRLYNYFNSGVDPVDIGNNLNNWVLLFMEYNKATTTMRHCAIGSALNSGVWSSGVVADLPAMPDFKLGASGAPWAQNLSDGQIDEPAIWSRVLTTDERAELYALGKGKYYAFD